MRCALLLPAAVLVLGLAPLRAAPVVDPANVSAPVAPPPAAALSALAPPGISPDAAAQVQALISTLPEGPTGDAATACEVIRCLAGSVGAGGGVSQCVAPIRKYLTIDPRKRLNFLKLCPKTSGQGDARMDRLVQIIARAPEGDGEDRICSASAINAVNRRPLGDDGFDISDDMPGDCSDYYAHEYTDLDDSVPVYIGEPLEGGFWSEPDDVVAAQARYEAAREERRRSGQQQQSAYSTL